MNVFTVSGNLGRDPEIRYTQSGQAVMTLAIAFQSGYGERKKTSWLRASVWGENRCQALAGILAKGKKVFVTGEINLDEYQGDDGQKRVTLEMNVRELDLAGGDRQQSPNEPNHAPQQHQQQGGQNYQQQRQQPRQQQQAPQQQQPQYSEPPMNFDDDIPFAPVGLAHSNHLLHVI